MLAFTGNPPAVWFGNRYDVQYYRNPSENNLYVKVLSRNCTLTRCELFAFRNFYYAKTLSVLSGKTST